MRFKGEVLDNVEIGLLIRLRNSCKPNEKIIKTPQGFMIIKTTDYKIVQILYGVYTDIKIVIQRLSHNLNCIRKNYGL